jgi:hypothetical protein
VLANVTGNMRRGTQSNLSALFDGAGRVFEED